MTGKGVNTKNNKRKDKNRIVLRTGEGQRPNGTYEYRWTDEEHKRRRVYAKTLEELREKEEEILKDRNHGIKAEVRYKTLNELFDVWKQSKRGLKDNTFQNYQYVYNMFVRPGFGKNRISEIKKSDVKRFYNLLADERCLKVSTIDSVHTVLHQVLDMAVDDDYLRANPSNNVLKELKQSHVFKTEKRNDIHCETIIDGYTDFIFVNRFGKAQHQGTLNKAIRRIIRDCNDKVLLEDENPEVLLPHFSCHSLRHTFTTRMCEAGVNIKVIQDALGHSDISTTLNIYADVTKETKKKEFIGLDEWFQKEA